MAADATAFNGEGVWLEANEYYDAERRFYEGRPVEDRRFDNPGRPERDNTVHTKPDNPGHHRLTDPSLLSASESDGMAESSLSREIAFVRQKIQKCLESGETVKDCVPHTVSDRLDQVESNQEDLKKKVAELMTYLSEVQSNLATVNKALEIVINDPKKVSTQHNTNIQNGSSSTADDDDLDLFGSDEEDESSAKLTEERLKAYAAKKAKKPAIVAKSSVVLDVKPWDDETDMKAMETVVRKIESDGLVWGASKLVPLAYGINKLQIVAIVEDEKVSIDWLQETISEIEEMVQSVDIAAFNKL